MELNIKTPVQALSRAYLRQPLTQLQIDTFKHELSEVLRQVNANGTEEYHKNLVLLFLNKVYYNDRYAVNVHDKYDMIIRLGNKTNDKIGVLLEFKKPTEMQDMVTQQNPNVKSFHQLILYYLRETIDNENFEIKNLIITNLYEWYIFDELWFEENIFRNKKLVKNYKEWKVSKNGKEGKTNRFYEQIAEFSLNEMKEAISCTYFDLREVNHLLENNEDKKLIDFYKILSPQHLLKQPFANDANTLNKGFYDELLHILGLKENGKKKLIERKSDKEKNEGSLIENTIEALKSRKFGLFEDIENVEQKYFEIALELCITWVNRVLFLKLLEAQLVAYHRNEKEKYSFLNSDKIKDFDELNELFFDVLAIPIADRKFFVTEKFGDLPYLNSSLFEHTDLERTLFPINNLKNRLDLPLFTQTVLLKSKNIRKINTLHYLFEFLNAYNFASDGTNNLQQDKTKLINAAVLGLIFEKINGYKEGAFFTPSYITMSMCRDILRKAVVQKFNEKMNWKCKDLDSLRAKIDYTEKEELINANKIINSIKICDPAVGSGHFLVSALNELIVIKSELKVLCYKDYERVLGYTIQVENDELLIKNNHTDEFFAYVLNQNDNPLPELQKFQESLFHEKQTLIENCLFGVDINPKSVAICRLRLWIELLKNAYYNVESKYKELETLPNIDINIKVGNSLISRFSTNFEISNLKNQKLRALFLDAFKKYSVDIFAYKTCKSANNKFEIRKRNAHFREFISQIYLADHHEYVKIKELKSQLEVKSLGFDYLYADTKQQNIAAEITQKEKAFFEKYKQIYGDALEWRFDFPEILDEEGNFQGFDVIISNPPYLVVKGGRYTDYELSSQSIDFLKVKYETASQQINTYILFMEMAGWIGNKNSIFSFIVPNTFLANKYSYLLRNHLVENFSIYEINNVGSVFPDAEVETAIVSFGNLHTDKTLLTHKKQSNLLDIQKIITLTEDKKFLISLDNFKIEIIKKLNTYPKLKQFANVWRGLTTGDDTKFIHVESVNDNCKPLITGSEINRYGVLTNVKYVEYLPEELDRARNENIFLLPEKLVSKFVGNRLTFTYDNAQFYVLNSGCITELIDNSLNIKFLLGLLNSKLLNFYFSYVFSDYREAFPTMKSGDIESLPISIGDEEKQNEIVGLVEEILLSKQLNPNMNTSDLENQIDLLIYQIYELTEEEQKIIEAA